MYRRSAYSAKSPKPNASSEFIVITHPFHPLAGQRLEVFFERRLAGDPAYSCDGGALGQMLIPATWTDRGMPEHPTRLSYESLVELAAVITAIRQP